MPQLHFEVGVVLARRQLAGQWGGVSWRAVALLPAAPPVPPWTPLGSGEGEDILYAGAIGMLFHSGETAHYRDNLDSGTPSVWLALHAADDRPQLVLATADPYEGEGLTHADGTIVEVVAMPQDIAERLAAFIEAHHVERPFYKRQRDRVDPRKRGFARASAAVDGSKDDR